MTRSAVTMLVPFWSCLFQLILFNLGQLALIQLSVMESSREDYVYLSFCGSGRYIWGNGIGRAQRGLSFS